MKELAKSITFRPIESSFFLLIVLISAGLLTTPFYYFALLIGPVILLLLLFGRNPQAGYYLILFWIPYDAYSEFKGYEFLSTVRFVGFWLLIVILFNFLLNKKSSYSYNIQSNLWPWLLIFFLVSFVSALMSDYVYISLQNLGPQLIAYIFFAMSLIFISRKGFYKTLPIVIIASVSINSILTLVGQFLEVSYFSYVGSVRRGIGGATNPNELSFIIIFSLPLLAHWFFSSRSLFEKNLAVVLFIINAVGIVATYSRGGGIGLAIVFFLIFIEHFRRFRPKYIGFVGSFIAVVILMSVIFVPPSYWERQTGYEFKEDSSLGSRRSFLYAGWDFFKENPIIGSGPGTFREKYQVTNYASQFAREAGPVKFGAHNVYIEYLVGQGLVGFFIFLVILLLTLKNFAIAKNHFQAYGNIEMASLVGAYRIFFISMTYFFIVLHSSYHKYFWVSLALSQVALRLSLEKSEGELDKKAKLASV